MIALLLGLVLLWCVMMEEPKPITFRAFCWSAAGILIVAVALPNLYRIDSPDVITSLKHWACWQPLVLGVMAGALGLWPPERLVKFFRPALDKPAVWLAGIAAMICFYIASGHMIAAELSHKKDQEVAEKALALSEATAKIVSEDLEPIVMAMRRYVLPRRLNRGQRLRITTYLRDYERSEATFVFNDNDDEARDFAYNFYSAIQEAGWTCMIVQTNSVLPGLRIRSNYTRETARAPHDPIRPKPDERLRDAFKDAGVTINGTGGGSSTATKDEVYIEIGPRPRGENAQAQPWD